MEKGKDDLLDTIREKINMQYILTEEEFISLAPKTEIDRYQKERNKYRVAALELAKMVAKHGKHGCVAAGTGPYCSECEAETLCPYDHKGWPK